MASAERLLNEAHYAFASISYGESLANKRHAARAKSLCRKIMRRYPTSMEAREARAILRRLGEESYVSTLPDQHRHMTQTSHHLGRKSGIAPVPAVNSAGSPAFDWGGLLAVILMTPKIVLGILGAVAFALFALLGPIVLMALVALVALTGPFRSMLAPAQRKQIDEFVVRANEFIEERRRSGSGLA
jgi:hypothetical protein